MKNLKHLAVLSALILSMLMCFDDSISLFLSIDTSESPIHSDCSDLTHHHHFSLTDHFFQKNIVPDSNTESATGFKLFLINQPIMGKFQTSIWQPPKQKLLIC
jgi:hypothetical protein